MESQPTQKEINAQEWDNPANWSGTWPFNAYFSKRDSRIWVPALWNSGLSPHMVNFGHRYGPLFVFGGLFLFGIVFLIAIAFRS